MAAHQSPHARRYKVGLPPGTLVHTGEQKTDRPAITLITYDAQHYTMRTLHTPDELPAAPADGVMWINVDGLHQVEVIDAIGRRFGVHPLVLEDIVSVGQRPKLEDYGDHLDLVLQMVEGQPHGRLTTEQISLVITRNVVLSFQEREGDFFDPVRERIKNGKGRSRTMGADYLIYVLIDTIVDHYFAPLEQLGEAAEQVELSIADTPHPRTMHDLHALKRQLILVRKAVWPLRDVVSGLERCASPLFRDATRVYLRDLHDHAIRAIDTVETLRDLLASLLDLYVSNLTRRLNEVMKVLTIVATIFIPLTLITGIYGMNFRYMPELEWRWGYPAVMGGMLAIGVAMVLYFRKKRWL
jgi:magnesium transporter